MGKSERDDNASELYATGQLSNATGQPSTGRIYSFCNVGANGVLVKVWFGARRFLYLSALPF